ncbi:hypothetical protein DFH06DRAFT_1137349 [Mycena polygramma]|nr:hypothetical protein DFH06DRAFT_1137349 [Mycena polygramma]
MPSVHGWWLHVSVQHASFRDFLINKERSSIFHIGSPEQHIRLACSILKAPAMTYEHKTDTKFRRKLGAGGGIHYVSRVTPSANLVPHVERRISPPPEHLIHRWEAFRFILIHEGFEQFVMLDLLGNPLRRLIQPVSTPSSTAIHALHARLDGQSKSTLKTFNALLSRSPTLVRVLQAKRLLLLNDSNNDEKYLHIFAVRVLLDISWDDILQCIYIAPVLYPRSSQFSYVVLVTSSTLCLSASLVDGGYAGWGRHIRSSPPANPEIMREVEDFSPQLSARPHTRSSPTDIHNVLQWLKAYLDESLRLYGQWYTHDDLEKKWQNSLGVEESLGLEIEDELIGYWESYLRRYMDVGDEDEEIETLIVGVSKLKLQAQLGLQLVLQLDPQLAKLGPKLESLNCEHPQRVFLNADTLSTVAKGVFDSAEVGGPSWPSSWHPSWMSSRGPMHDLTSNFDFGPNFREVGAQVGHQVGPEVLTLKHPIIPSQKLGAVSTNGSSP